MKNTLITILAMVRYNFRIIFGSRFVYFVLAAVLYFVINSVIYILTAENVEGSSIYGNLIFPAILLIFYPTVFGIQMDADARTLEIIFGIPDYRFKVWLVRLFMIFILVFLLLIPFAAISSWAITSIKVFEMALSLMPMLFFLGTLGFMLSTVVRNGSGAAVIMIVIAVAMLIVGENLSIPNGFYNFFLNPYDIPNNTNQLLWNEIILKNRILMLSSGLVMMLVALLRLQNREKFLQ